LRQLPDRNWRVLYCTLYPAVSDSNYVGPRTRSPTVSIYGDKQLQLRASEFAGLKDAVIRLEHDGPALDGRWVGFRMNGNEPQAIALVACDSDEKRRLLDRIGPGREFTGVSVGVSWPANKDGRVVLGPASLEHVAITRKPYYPSARIHLCASESEAANDEYGMLLLLLAAYVADKSM
jgi:hypothetical protein